MLRKKYKAYVELQQGEVKIYEKIVFREKDSNINTIVFTLDGPFMGKVQAFITHTEIKEFKTNTMANYDKEIKEVELFIEDGIPTGKYEAYLVFQYDEQRMHTETFEFEFIE